MEGVLGAKRLLDGGGSGSTRPGRQDPTSLSGLAWEGSAMHHPRHTRTPLLPSPPLRSSSTLPFTQTHVSCPERDPLRAVPFVLHQKNPARRSTTSIGPRHPDPLPLCSRSRSPSTPLPSPFPALHRHGPSLPLTPLPTKLFNRLHLRHSGHIFVFEASAEGRVRYPWKLKQKSFSVHQPYKPPLLSSHTHGGLLRIVFDAEDDSGI